MPSGEKVIVDRQKSLERMTLIFYWSINIGAFFRLATSYCERRVGFWLAFFVPIIVYLFLPVIFFFLERKLQKEAPQGSLLQNAWKILRVSLRGNWIKRVRSGVFWDYAKPSNMLARGEKYYNSKRQNSITWNEQWVLDVKQTVNSCKIFIYFPIFFITDGGLGSVQASQAGSMSTEGIPNDLFSNFNPLTIIVLIPILDYLIYPTLRRYRINLKPVDRITFGFILCALSQVAGAVIQHRIYSTSPCGNFATTCAETSPLSAWREVSLYILQAAGECFAATTAYELAYTRSPPQMKGLVMAIFLFTNSISAAISQALVGALVDPHLIWPFTAMAVIGFVTAGMFRFHFRNLHKDMEVERIERERLDQTQRDGEEAGDAVFDQKEN